ncbi:MAG: glycosyltransferase family 2 protein [Prevotella sp.]|nr:glycosyltransferase family 2 protein [Prevotella sp.]
MTTPKEQIIRQNVCVVVPTYNNGTTIAGVLQRVLQLTDRVIVVVDGCTDDTRTQLTQFSSTNLQVIDYEQNRGKGHALVAGFRRALELGYDYAITLDSDGQHFPEDIPLFVAALEQHPGALIVGSRNLDQKNMSGGSLFANKFSNFWFTVQTGLSLSDTQTGFRLYPLHRLSGLQWITSRYEAELELLVFSAWKSVEFVSLPIRVYYPPREERVSHFRPLADFGRISVLNTVLCFLAVVYGWPRMLLHKLFKGRNGQTTA